MSVEFLGIDGDPLVYACGNASCHWQHHLCELSDADGRDPIMTFDKAEDRNQWILETYPRGEGQELKTTQHKKCLDWFYENEAEEDVGKHFVQIQKEEPVAFSLHLVKLAIEKTLNRCKPEGYKVFLSGSDSFRHRLPYGQKYKGNRDPSAKPLWYQEIRDYMQTHWDAVVCTQYEADDRLSMIFWQDYRDNPLAYAIGSIDKDLDQIPCRHFDWMKDKRYTVEKEYAKNMLHAQGLAGDSTDNIPGLPMVGMTKAYKMLEEVDNVVYSEWALEQYARLHKEWGESTKNDKPAIQQFLSTDPEKAFWDTYTAVRLLRNEKKDIKRVEDMYKAKGWS